MIRRLGKQLATVLLAVSITGCDSADNEAEGLLAFQEGVAAYEAGDYALALSKYLEAADAGNDDAQIMIGRMYRYGHGVPQNNTEAIKWYRMAAVAGNADAQDTIGIWYMYGVVVPQNPVMAYVWLSLAAAQGREMARIYRDRLAEQLTPEQLARGQDIAARCFESNYKDCK